MPVKYLHTANICNYSEFGKYYYYYYTPVRDKK